MSTKENDNMTERRKAFEELEKLCRHIPNLDDDKELAEYREEKYGQGIFDKDKKKN